MSPVMLRQKDGSENPAMSPRFRRSLLRSLPLLLLVLVLSWGVDRIWGHYSPWYGFFSWLSVFGLNWAIRTEPNRRN